MTTFTKHAISEVLWDMLGELPMEKITVSAICRRCGISRNTFYYHYGDVIEVVEDTLAGEQARLAGLADAGSFAQALDESTRLMRENWRAIRHLYDSPARDRLMAQLRKAAQTSMESFVAQRAEAACVDASCVTGIAYLYASMVEGITADAMRHAPSYDLEVAFGDARRYLEGTVALALENAAKDSVNSPEVS